MKNLSSGFIIWLGNTLTEMNGNFTGPKISLIYPTFSYCSLKRDCLNIFSRLVDHCFTLKIWCFLFDCPR